MQPLKGSLVALVTPMDPDGGVDYDSLDKLIEWHIEEGTNGIVSVGTTGESATVDFDEHIDVISHTVNYVDKRIPVIAGTGANSTSEALDLTLESKKVGADYALLVTPYYNKPNQRGLIQHYTKIADSVDIPQILYNVPSRTACDLLPDTAMILSNHKNIVGIKEAVNQTQRFKELVSISQSNETFKVYSGDDPTFLQFLKEGCHGVISVAANVIPKSISDICNLIRNNDNEKAAVLNNLNANLYRLLFVESNPIPVKWMLYKMGFIKQSIRLPLIELNETFHDGVMSELNKLKLI